MKHYMAKLILGLFFSTIGVGSVLAEDLKIGLITTLSGGGGYLGQDVRDGFLLAIKECLERMLRRENRWELAKRCFKCVPVFSELDRLRFNQIFEH